MRIVASDPETWNDVWSRHNAEAPAPAVDFDKELGIFVTLGAMQSTCFDIQVSRLAEFETHTVVEVTAKIPGPGEGCGAAVVTPTHAVVTSKVRLPVIFIERITTAAIS